MAPLEPIRFAVIGLGAFGEAYLASLWGLRAAAGFELDYYGHPSRGAVPTWRNEMAAMSWAYWLLLDGLRPAAQVTAPSLLVHSDNCVFPAHVRSIYDSLAGPKRLHWSGEGSQTAFSAQPAQVEEAVAEAVKHFQETLP